MRMLILLRDTDNYPDRAKMFDILGDHEDVTILTSKNNSNLEQYDNIRKIETKKTLLDFSMGTYRFLKKNEYKFDLIHDNFHSILFPILFSKIKVPIVSSYYTNNVDWFIRTRKIKSNLHYDIHKLKGLSIELLYNKKVNYHFVQNYQVKKDFTNFFKIPYNRIFVVPTAIDLEYFKNKCKPKIIKGTFNFLYVGNIFNVKGIYELITASSLLKKNFSGKFKLTLIGRIHPYEKNKIKKYIQNFNLKKNTELISFLPRSKLLSYYNKAHCFVFPSFHEGSPRVLKEALAMKIPTLCSDIPGNRIIDPKGEILNYFSKGNIDEMYQLMSKIWINYDKYLEKSEKNSFKVLKKFDYSNVAKEYLKIYREILK